jgi:hypothetical protein
MDDADRRLREQRLTERLFDLYDRVGKGTGYWANYFLRDLKRLGGLEVARKLLNAPAVSQGFERLKKEHLLSESVEAVVLAPEFRPLFTDPELSRARKRLANHGYTPADLETNAVEMTPDLRRLLQRVESATDQSARWDLRNDVVAYGSSAREAMREWLAREHLVPFALSVLEKLSPGDAAAPRILDAYVAGGGKERALAIAAMDRIRMARQDPELRKSLPQVEVYRSTGSPEAATGGYCDVLVDGQHCRNPARHPLPDGRSVCTTHRKAIERAQLRG